MKRVVLSMLVLAVAVAIGVTGASTSSASAATTKATYIWSSGDKLDFEDMIVRDAQKKGDVSYPYLYADCLRKSAEKSFRSFNAWINGPIGRWLHSSAVTHCITEYAIG
jgi:hypothetical protein